MRALKTRLGRQSCKFNKLFPAAHVGTSTRTGNVTTPSRFEPIISLITREEQEGVHQKQTFLISSW